MTALKLFSRSCFLLSILSLSVVFSSCGGGDSTLVDEVGFQLTNAAGIAQGVKVVAFQDGSGAWQRISQPGVDGTYRHPVTSADGKYAFAVARDALNGGGTVVTVYKATMQEIRLIKDSTHTLPGGSVTISGTVRGATSGENVWISIGQHSQRITSSHYSISIVPGTYDVIAWRGYPNGDIKRYWIKRNNILTINTSMDIDFTEPGLRLEASPLFFRVTGGVANAAGWSLKTQTQTSTLVEQQTSQTSFQLPIVPTSSARSEDYQCVYAVAGDYFKSSCKFAPPAVELDLSSARPFNFVKSDDLSLSFSAFPGAQYYYFDFDGDQNPRLAHAMYLTRGYVGSSGEATFPDLSGVPGWQSDWSLNGSYSVYGVAAGSNKTTSTFMQGDLTNQFYEDIDRFQASGLQ